MGKTSFMKMEAVSLAKQGIPVLYVSCEVDDEQLLKSILGGMARIPARVYKGLEPMTQEQYQRHMDASEELYNLPFYTLSGGRNSFSKVTTRCNLIKKERGMCPVLILDYIQWLIPKRKGLSFTESIEEEIKDYKDFGIREKTPVLALCQLAREASKPDAKGQFRRPQMQDLSESKAIEQAATSVLLLYREEYYKARHEGRDEARNSAAEILIPKNRYGPTGKELLVWDSWRAMYSEAGA